MIFRCPIDVRDARRMNCYWIFLIEESLKVNSTSTKILSEQTIKDLKEAGNYFKCQVIFMN